MQYDLSYQKRSRSTLPIKPRSIPRLNDRCVLEVVHLFPGEGPALRSLAKCSDGFRGLCEDYGLTVETLRIMETRDLPEDAERITEYRQFASELKAQLSAMLQKAGK